MATWQADFALEPDLLQPPDDFRIHLDRLLPRGRVWSQLQEAWGLEDSNRIDVFYDPRGAVEIRCRVDVRRMDPAWLELLLAFVRYTRRQLQTPDGRTVEPHLTEFTLFLRGSPAWRFVEDPSAYLRRVAIGGLPDA